MFGERLSLGLLVGVLLLAVGVSLTLGVGAGLAVLASWPWVPQLVERTSNKRTTKQVLAV